MHTQKPIKEATVRARIEPEVKTKAEEILNELGISPTQAINMLYRRVIKERGWPCELKEPNEETKAVLEATRRGENLEEFDTIDEMLVSLHSDTQNEEDIDK